MMTQAESSKSTIHNRKPFVSPEGWVARNTTTSSNSASVEYVVKNRMIGENASAARMTHLPVLWVALPRSAKEQAIRLQTANPLHSDRAKC